MIESIEALSFIFHQLSFVKMFLPAGADTEVFQRVL
jgi:hypothetical protein